MSRQTVACAASTPPKTQRLSLSFTSDLDRELFATELEFAFRKAPRRMETWNASIAVPVRNTNEAGFVKRLAQKYDGVKLSHGATISAAADKWTKFDPELPRYIINLENPRDEERAGNALMKAGQRGFSSSGAKIWLKTNNIDKMVAAIKAKGVRVSGVEEHGLQAPAMSASLPGEDHTAPTSDQPTACDMSLSFSNSQAAHRFAAGLMRMGAKVSVDGPSVKCSFPFAQASKALSFAAKLTGAGDAGTVAAGPMTSDINKPAQPVVLMFIDAKTAAQAAKKLQSFSPDVQVKGAYVKVVDLDRNKALGVARQFDRAATIDPKNGLHAGFSASA